jgi:ABC-type antimicrobial peptide transport system permease subunit
MSQVNRPSPDFLLVRTAADPATLAGAVREAIRSADREQPAARIRTMREYIDLETRDRAHQLRILAVFAGLALFLAALGIYGVLAYSVASRRREIGIRRALGGRSANVTGLILREGLALAIAGLAIGSALALAAARAMRTLLYGVRPADPVVLAAGAAVLIVSAVAACIVPSLSASRVDPAAVLREE